MRRESVRLDSESVNQVPNKRQRIPPDITYLAALPDEVKTIITEALTLIAARTWIKSKKKYIFCNKS